MEREVGCAHVGLTYHPSSATDNVSYIVKGIQPVFHAFEFSSDIKKAHKSGSNQRLLFYHRNKLINFTCTAQSENKPNKSIFKFLCIPHSK